MPIKYSRRRRLRPSGATDLPEWIKWASAIALVALATGLLAVMRQFFGDIGTFLPFVLAVTLTAYVGGRGPAYLAIALCLVVVSRLAAGDWHDPRQILAWVGYLAFFSVVAGLIVEAMHRLHARTNRLKVSVLHQRESHRRLLQLKRRFQHVADNAPVLLWRTDPDGRAIWFNEPWYQFVGRAPEQEAGLGWLHSVYPNERERVEKELVYHMGERRRFEFEYRMRRADGHYRLMLMRGAPTFDLRGQEFTGYTGSCLDISDRAESDSRLRSILDHASAIVFLKDRSGRYLFVNEEFLRSFGIRPSEVVGRLDREVFPGSTSDVLRDHDAQVWGGAPSLTAEETLPQPSGRRTYITTKFLLRDLDDVAYALCGIATDISDRKRAEEALIEADRRKDVFVAVLAHELRNPLAPIRTAVSLLGRTPLSSDATRARDIIDRQSRQMALLLDDLLDISRVTRGTLELRKSRVQVSNVVEAAIETARPLIDSRGHTLHVELQQPATTISADPLRLSQILGNLLTNAAKYTDPGGVITLTAWLANDGLHLQVRDTGIGLSESALTRIFQMFAQLHGKEGTSGGLGIGLALSRGLVELHGGRIEASSAGPGHGSEFTIVLPAGDPDAEAPEIKDAQAAMAAAGEQRILIADDNQDAAVSLEILLKGAGFEVATVHDGQAALDMARAFRPRFAILDIGMPALTGYEVAEHIRSEPWGAELVLIALTGWGQLADKQRALASGFDLHLTKPVDPSKLEAYFAAASLAHDGDRTQAKAR